MWSWKLGWGSSLPFLALFSRGEARWGQVVTTSEAEQSLRSKHCSHLAGSPKPPTLTFQEWHSSSISSAPAGQGKPQSWEWKTMFSGIVALEGGPVGPKEVELLDTALEQPSASLTGLFRSSFSLPSLHLARTKVKVSKRWGQRAGITIVSLWFWQRERQKDT